MSLTREQILECIDRRVEKLNVPAWGGDVYVRSLTGTERDEWEQENLVKDPRTKEYSYRLRNIRARLVVKTVCDENGTRIFTDRDADRIGEKNAAVLTKVYEVAARLSGITPEDVEELAKNSGADESAGSTSA